MQWLLGESTHWRACDDMALAHSRDAWRSLPCSIACLLARQMAPEEGYIAGHYGTLDGPCLPCKMDSAEESTGFSQNIVDPTVSVLAATNNVPG